MSLLYKILGVFCAIDLFVWWQSFRALGRTVHRGVRLALHGFFAVQIAILALLLWSAFHQAGVQFLSPQVLALTFLWHLLVAPVALVASLLGLTGEAVAALLRLFSRQPAASAPETSEARGVTRRDFLGTVAALTPPVLTFSLGAVAAAQLGEFRVRRLTLSLASLPPELDGMTIAHLSDLHVGPLTRGPVLQKIVNEANKLEADLMLFTGDLINSDLGFLPAALETLRALRPAPVLCEGNHDLGAGSYGFENHVKAAGFYLLVNESITVHVHGYPVQLLGLRWGGPDNYHNRHNERALFASMEALLKQRKPGAFPILLAHHPHAWDYCGDIPLTLSGHTHGGQLMLDAQHGFGPLMFRYWSGAYVRPEPPARATQALVVNNGIGNWFPLRTAAPAEIVHLTLRCG